MMNRATVSAVSNGDIMQWDGRSARARLINQALPRRGTRQGLAALLTLRRINTCKWRLGEAHTQTHACKHKLSICIYRHTKKKKPTQMNTCICTKATSHFPDLQQDVAICRVTAGTQFAYICLPTALPPRE